MNQALLKSDLFTTSAEAQSLTLMAGELPAGQVYDPVNKLIATMRSFYWLRNLSHQERFSHNDKWAEEMIVGMSTDSEELLALLRQAQKNGDKIKVIAKIEVELE